MNKFRVIQVYAKNLLNQIADGFTIRHLEYLEKKENTKRFRLIEENFGKI